MLALCAEPNVSFSFIVILFVLKCVCFWIFRGGWISILYIGQVQNLFDECSYIGDFGHMLDEESVLQQLFIVWPVGVLLLQTSGDEVIEGRRKSASF